MRASAAALALVCAGMPRARAETPKAFLTRVVSLDFEGNADGRLNRIVDPPADPDLAPGVYLLNESPLVIVDHWEPAGELQSKGESVCVTFRFLVVARSQGEGMPSWEREEARALVRIGHPREEEVAYCAVERDGKWKLKQAPDPRVGRLTMLAHLGDELADAERRLAKLKNPDPRALLNTTRIRDWYKRQLDVLSAP
jgi:hypothetical protein